MIRLNHHTVAHSTRAQPNQMMNKTAQDDHLTASCGEVLQDNSIVVLSPNWKFVSTIFSKAMVAVDDGCWNTTTLRPGWVAIAGTFRNNFSARPALLAIRLPMCAPLTRTSTRCPTCPNRALIFIK